MGNDNLHVEIVASGLSTIVYQTCLPTTSPYVGEVCIRRRDSAFIEFGRGCPFLGHHKYKNKSSRHVFTGDNINFGFLIDH